MTPLVLAGVLIFAALMVMQWVFYRHAYAMTHFVRYPKPAAEPTGIWIHLRRLLFGLPMCRLENRASPGDYSLAYETHTFAGALGRLSAWHIPHNNRRGMVLLFHGYQGCKAHLLAEAKAFHEMGYACLLIDFPGSGDSEGEATTVGRHEALDVARTVDYVRDHWKNETVILFGASMGSAAILRAVYVHRVEPDGIILECPFDRLVNAVGARCRMLGLPAFPTAHLLVFWGGLLVGFNGFRHNPVDYARGVRCPVLLLHGTNDVKTPVAQVERIYAQLAGEKMVHYFEGLGHESYVAKQPEEWKRQVRRFLLSQAEVVLLKAS